MGKIALVTPPYLPPVSPCSETAGLKGYLAGRGHQAQQYDLSAALLDTVLSREFLEQVFATPPAAAEGGQEWSAIIPAAIERMYALRSRYIATVDTVMRFLRGGDRITAEIICRGDFLPQASHFASLGEPAANFGWMGTQDCARHMCSLYLMDLEEYLQFAASDSFRIRMDHDRRADAPAEFAPLAMKLAVEPDVVERTMLGLLGGFIDRTRPGCVYFAVPMADNMAAALRCSRFVKDNYPGIVTAVGGRFPAEALLDMTDLTVFGYTDFIVTGGEAKALEAIASGDPHPPGTIASDGSRVPAEHVCLADLSRPDYGDTDPELGFPASSVLDPVERLSTGYRWNRIEVTHGCYRAGCAFCNCLLDRIARYDSLPAAEVADRMDRIAQQTGINAFRFVGAPVPPTVLRELSLELLRRNRKYSWWATVRYDKEFTGDLCMAMAAAGCIAVSGGLWAVNDRLYAFMCTGTDTGQAIIALRNFCHAGIMTDCELIYGLPTQTLQETVDSLEALRQLFLADLVGTARWHRYTMTVHSPAGREPELFGVRRKGTVPNPFANNTIFFADNRGYDIRMAGEALEEALAAYKTGEALDKPVHRWFGAKAPHTTLEETMTAGRLIEPDACRIFDDKSRLVWLGAPVLRTNDGLTVLGAADEKQLRFATADAEFMLGLFDLCGDLSHTTTLGDARTLYRNFSDEPFAILYHSKKWDILREYGLLQL